MMENSEIAIIGAGVAGIAAAKSLLEKGLKPVIFEKSTRMGGLWNYGKTEGSPLYASLKTNISKQMMAFSDFPFGREIADFPSHAQVNAYLKSYVAHHNLEQHVVFGAVVQRVEFAGRQFKLTIMKDGQSREAFFEKLVVAAGRFDVPCLPPIPGLNFFSGQYHPF